MISFPNTEFVKFPVIDEVDESLLFKSLEHFFKKVSFSSNVKLSLSHKEYAKGGLKVQHEIHGHLNLNGKKFFAEDVDWQLLSTIQSVLKKLEKEALKQHSHD